MDFPYSPIDINIPFNIINSIDNLHSLHENLTLQETCNTTYKFMYSNSIKQS